MGEVEGVPIKWLGLSVGGNGGRPGGGGYGHGRSATMGVGANGTVSTGLAAAKVGNTYHPLFWHIVKWWYHHPLFLHRFWYARHPLFSHGVKSKLRRSRGWRRGDVERGKILEVLDKGWWEELTGEVVLLDRM